MIRIFVVCGLAIGGVCAVDGTPEAKPTAPTVSTLELPPSPSKAPGVRIWPDPHFTHWPSIVYRDESRNVAFTLPVKSAGINGTIAWTFSKPLPFTLPSDADAISGLLPLPTDVGTHQATVTLDGNAASTKQDELTDEGIIHQVKAPLEAKSYSLSLRVVDAREAWPLARLEQGYPVDHDGKPVVLQDRRRGTREERVFSLLDADGTRPTGRAVVVGDPLEAMGSQAMTGLDADLRVASDERFPHHAVLVALASVLADPLPSGHSRPRTIVWSPGNQSLISGAWTSEEERLLGAVRTRCERLAIAPRLVLALPPLPIETHLQARAAERRELLLRSANRLGWAVIDLARAAGAPEQANLFAPQVFTTYPVGAAQERMRIALKEALVR
jgi:hypothetical protein